MLTPVERKMIEEELESVKRYIDRALTDIDNTQLVQSTLSIANVKLTAIVTNWAKINK